MKKSKGITRSGPAQSKDPGLFFRTTYLAEIAPDPETGVSHCIIDVNLLSAFLGSFIDGTLGNSARNHKGKA